MASVNLLSALPGAVVMAPMTKGSNLPYRRLCVELGARITVSEMTLARRLKLRRLTAVVLLYIIVVLLTAGALLLVLPPVITQLIDFISGRSASNPNVAMPRVMVCASVKLVMTSSEALNVRATINKPKRKSR